MGRQRTDPLILHLDLDAFFIAVERQRRPQMEGRPIVVGGGPASRGMVAAASREARRCGIRVGMPLAQASVHCPEAVFLDGALDEAFAAAHRVDELLRTETADVEWPSIDEVFVGLPASLGPTRALETATRIHQSVTALGFDAACGVARSKLVARVASRLGRPRGVVHVLDGYEARFLSPMKIEMLPGVSLPLARKLRAAGIRRLGQLARLSEEQLVALVGRAALPLRHQAAGVDASRIRRTALPPARLTERQLPVSSDNSAALEASLRDEVERIGRDLRSRGVFARSITLRLRFADGRTEARTAALAAPAALDDALLGAALDLLPRLHTGERPVRAISVSCSGLIAGSGELFLLQQAR